MIPACYCWDYTKVEQTDCLLHKEKIGFLLDMRMPLLKLSKKHAYIKVAP
jgi:hypothetical protein